MSDQDQTQNDELAEKLKKAQEEAAQKDAAEAEEVSEQSELEKMTLLAQRTMADFQNYKRRQEEERSTLIKTANLNLIKALLPIMDNFDRAQGEWTEGIKMCVEQFKSVMTQAGVEEVQAEGAQFDPDFHEAVAQGPGPENQVIQVMEKGYKLGDRVVRHAKVQVGNGQ